MNGPEVTARAPAFVLLAGDVASHASRCASRELNSCSRPSDDPSCPRNRLHRHRGWRARNTTNSIGRLTLNVLLSFAQFEREVTGERIRDKITRRASPRFRIRCENPQFRGYEAAMGHHFESPQLRPAPCSSKLPAFPFNETSEKRFRSERAGRAKENPLAHIIAWP